MALHAKERMQFSATAQQAQEKCVSILFSKLMERHTAVSTMYS